MTLAHVCAVCLVAPLVALVAGVAWHTLRPRRRPAYHYRAGFDACHPLPDVAPRVLAPLDYEAHYRTVRGIWEPNAMKDTIVVARPLGWDAQPRSKEY